MKLKFVMIKKKSKEERIQEVSLYAQPLNVNPNSFNINYSNQEKVEISIKKVYSIPDIEVSLNKKNNGPFSNRLKNIVKNKSKLIKNNLLLKKLNIIEQLVKEKNQIIAEQKSEDEKNISLTFLKKQKNTETILRSYRLDDQVATRFSKFCMDQNFSQRDLLSQALFEFIEKYSC